MQERVKEVPKRILEWWNKFSAKQKTLIAGIAIAVIIGLAFVVKVLTTPTMITIQNCKDTKEAAQVKELLEGEDIYFEVSDDGLNFQVKTEDRANASILLGQNGIPAASYDLENVFEGGFSQTEADKDKRYQLYMEKQLEEDLQQLDVVNSATVNLSVPTDDGTVLALQEDSYAAVRLSLSGEMDEEVAAGLAKWIATAIGNKGTDDITIIDATGNMLFSGGDSATAIGTANTQLAYKAKAENAVKSQVKDVMMGTNIFNNVSVGLSLKVSFRDTIHRQYTEDGSEHGPVTSRRVYEQETTGGTGGVPGTDPNNDDTGYVLDDGANSNSTIAETNEQYATSEQITETTGGSGEIDYENSSITVVASQYRNYNEDALRASGQLDDMTFDEFVAENRERTRMELDEDYVQMVARATGFPEENVMVVGYEVPFFEYSDSSGRGVMDYLPVAIALAIMAMLGYVVFRSTRREQTAEVEPELSVESLLATTKEAEEEGLEDIGFSDKSETRVLIEKFVDENPEAVASLLRNWLNEEWE